MMRKQRRPVTFEKYLVVKRLFETTENTFKEIGEIVNLCERTVSSLIKKIESGQRFVSSSERHKATIALKNVAVSGEESAIYNAVVANNLLTQEDIRTIVLEAGAGGISQPTISRRLKKLNLTRKRVSLAPIERNSPERLEERAIFAADISRRNIDDVYYLDETGFNRHLVRYYGYSPANTKVVATVPANRGTNISCMAMIGREGLIAHTIKHGPFKSRDFEAFLAVWVIPFFQGHPNRMLLMDNARIHHTEGVRSLLTTNNILFGFLPAYSPQLNPIEEFFSMVKSRYCDMGNRNMFPRVEERLEHLLALPMSYANQCEGFYRNMLRWVEKARNREIFD